MEADDGAIGRRFDHPKLRSLFLRHGDRGDGRLRTLVHMELDHLADVHAVDVIGAEDRHVMRIGLLDQVDVLMQRVGCAAIPVLAGGPHLRGHRDDEVLLQQPAHFPSFTQVLQQALALELDQNVDGIDPRVDQVAQDEVDDTISSPEGRGRLGPLLGQR